MNRERIRNLVSNELKIPTTKFRFANNLEQLIYFVESDIGYPCVVKPIMSSSGKGQSLINTSKDISNAWDFAQETGRAGKGRVIVEEYLDFDFEITLLTVKSKGLISFCPPIGHKQKDGDYIESWQPQLMSEETLKKSQKIAEKVVNKISGNWVFGVALFMMLMILLLQFNSFYSGFLILFSVVMSTAGVFIGLMITGQAFGIVMTGVGVNALAGIVVNNNIILIDTFDFLKTKTNSVKDAIIKTGAQRLRPVLLTTTTTVLGLLPMVTMTNVNFLTREISRGSPDTQWWVQLSTAIVFGLIFATILTLIVTPSALMLRENIRNWYIKKITS